jgi:hypothetical protein
MVDKIKILGFEKDLALWAAETKGFFAAQDLTVAFLPWSELRKRL